MVTATKPTFLYPTSRQFPFDEVTEQIIRALEERNWDVPDITVDFDVYGSGDYRMVQYLTGPDFRLWFCRIQGSLGSLNDIAAVTRISVPRKELHVNNDESGPTFYVYTGKNWKKDQGRFSGSSKFHSKRKGESPWYLKYSGSCNCGATSLPHTHPGRRPPILVADNDLGREYSPKGKQPESYETSAVFAEFTTWLKDHVLAAILEQPVASQSS